MVNGDSNKPYIRFQVVMGEVIWSELGITDNGEENMIYSKILWNGIESSKDMCH